ncbi:MAG: GNAT family N-acetyltransferase [Burkholderiales bacterium]
MQAVVQRRLGAQYAALLRMASKRKASVAIDFARDEDVARLADLLGLLLAQEADFAPDPEKQRRALRAIVSDASVGRIYVARDGADPVAMVSLLYTLSTAEGGKAAWLEDLVVRPDRRGQGIGTTLLEHVAAQARADGVLRITLLTDPGNERAHALYRSLGFEFSSMRPMRLKLL